MYSDVVLGFEHHHFEDIPIPSRTARLYARYRSHRRRLGRPGRRYKDAVARETGKDFPQDRTTSCGARSCSVLILDEPRAVTYRRLHDIPEEWGTAVNTTGDGVRHMRDLGDRRRVHAHPTGETRCTANSLSTPRLRRVAGIRTPQDITEFARKEAAPTGIDGVAMRTRSRN